MTLLDLINKHGLSGQHESLGHICDDCWDDRLESTR